MIKCNKKISSGLNRKKLIFIICFIIFTVFAIYIAKAQFFDTDFDPNYIISDFELENYNSMSIEDIQYFLNSNNGILKNYKTKNPNTGRLMSVPEIIKRASLEYKINPQYLLTLLQKEQSLITDPSPSQKQLDWATGYSICDDCNMNDPALLKFKGIYNQIYSAAKRNRFYIESRDQKWLFQMYKAYNIDNKLIVPKNQATVNLYNYTPHVNGNYNFWKIWQKWFTKKYPNGSIVKEQGSSIVWLIDEDKRKSFITWTAFLSRYKAKNIITINHGDLIKYPIGQSIQFENYSYLKDPDNNIYLLDNDKLRKFESREVVRYFGINPEEIINITWDDYNYYTKGENITMKSTYPTGAVLSSNQTGNLYYAKNGFKYPILDNNILNTNYPNQIKTFVSEEELSKLEIGSPIKFIDGTILKQKNDPAVLIVADGKLHLIKNEQIFNKFGYNWSDIISVEKSIIDMYQIGSPIEINSENINSNELLKDKNSARPL